MLKGSNNKPNVVNGNIEELKEIFKCLRRYDFLSKTSYSKEFYYVFIDEKKYTMLEIAIMTGNSESTIRRHIREFNYLIKNKI